MLYLIQSLVEKDNGDIFKILKIGYSGDVESRMRAYYSCNPGTKLLGTREGDTILESLFHSYFKKYKYKGKHFNEWFYWNEEIIEGFSKLNFLQEGYENHFSNVLIHPEDLLLKYWDDLKKDLEDKVKSNPSLSEFFDLGHLGSIFKNELVKIYDGFVDYFQNIDFSKTLVENGLDLEFSEFNTKVLSPSIFSQVGCQESCENPLKNDITLFYKTQKNPVTFEKFKKFQDQRKKSTEIILSDFERLSKLGKTEYLMKLKRDSEPYLHDFVGISEKTNLPVYNYLVYIASERALEVSQKDYQDCISVTKVLEDSGFGVEDYMSEDDLILQDFLDNHFYKTGLFHEKMKMYCEFCDTHKNDPEIMVSLGHKIQDPKYKMYYEYYGTSGCRAVSYKEKELYRGWKDTTKEDQLREIIYQKFKAPGKYPMANIKEVLSEVYDTLGIFRNAKATDLRNYFKISRTNITLPDKTIVPGFKLEPLN